MKKIIKWFLIITGGLLIIATLLSLIYNSSLWFIRILNFPRLLMLICLVICMLIYAIFFFKKSWGNYLYLFGLFVSIFIQSYILFPYTFIAPKIVPDAAKSNHDEKIFSLVIANVLMKNNNYRQLLDIIEKRNPHAVLLMEVNDEWISSMQPLLKMYPYKILYPLPNTYGMALYSKLPLSNEKILFLHNDSVPSFLTDVQIANKSFKFFGLHPVAPIPSKHPTNIGEKELALIKAAQIIKNLNPPVLAAGDLNDVGWSHNTNVFEKNSKLNDVRRGRGLYNTFNAQSSIFRWPLDYVYVSKEFKVRKIERLDAFGSDHYPFYVEVALE